MSTTPIARRTWSGILPGAHEGIAYWALPVFLAGYVLMATLTWGFPRAGGLPFPLVFSAVLATFLAAWRLVRGVPTPVTVAAIVSGTAMAMTSVAMFMTQPMRDLELYLKAGERWLAGAPVYMTVPLAVRPEDLSNYPFLYPPPTLPLFAALAQLPVPVAAAVWTIASAVAAIAALRILGVRWRWAMLALLWPPLAQGLYVGNVAVPLFLLLAAAPIRAVGLVLLPVFKLHSGIAALWLLRPENRRDLVVGVVALAFLVGASALVVDPRLWLAWLEGLRQFRISQDLLPDFLYGIGLGRYLPPIAIAVGGVVVLVLAVLPRDRLEQLSRLGVATVVAAPSLFAHGFLAAVPAALRLDARWLWLVLGITSCAPGAGWFAAVGVIVASWFRPRMRKRRGFDHLHPLGDATRPWRPTRR